MDSKKDPTRPYYTIPLWYPYFFIALGIFFFVPIAIALNLFTTDFVFNQASLQKYGSTIPAFFYWMGAAAFGSFILMAMGLHMMIFAHKE